MGAIMPGALAPTSRDFDWVLRMLVTYRASRQLLRTPAYFNCTYSHNIVEGNVLCYRNNERDLCFNGILDRLPTLWCRDEDRSGIRLQLLLGFPQIWKKW
jgi:hypothetical protein